MKNLFWLFALLLLVPIFQSCEQDNSVNEPTDLVAPEIPPMAMFAMPTGDFDESNIDTLGGVVITRDDPETYQNWFHAAANLVVWSVIGHLHMALPTAAFAAAVSQTPEYIGDLTFQWTYVYEAPPGLGGQAYDVSLTGQYTPEFEAVIWTLTVSEQGGFTDFVWYTGVTSVTNDEGEFTLNRNPQNPENYLRLNYQGDEATGQGTLRFTNIVPGSTDFGDYIEYREAPGNPYDRAFDVLYEAGNFLEIQWNEAAGNGRVRHPIHFGDDAWRCWDTSYQDVDC